MVFDKSKPMPRSITVEHQICDRSWYRAIWHAQPEWVNRAAIRAIYARAKRQGKTVDHIIPLRGEGVSGLHVPWNLQLLDATTNYSKGNKWRYEQLGLFSEPEQLTI